MKKGFKNINKDIKAPKSVKRDVMWHIERVFFVEAIFKHFTVNFSETFISLFKNLKNNHNEK